MGSRPDRGRVSAARRSPQQRGEEDERSDRLRARRLAGLRDRSRGRRRPVEAARKQAHIAEVAHVPYAAAYPLRGMAGPTAVANEIDAEENAGERLLEQAAQAARVADAERRVEVGVPAERLAELADEEDAELIVVGSHGRGGFTAAFLGSVSNSLAGVERCPVAVVPPGVSEAIESPATDRAQAST